MKTKTARWWYLCMLLCLFLFSLWKIRLGVHSDEVHSVAVGDMISRGDSLFKECWFYLQMSSVFTAPVIWVYEKVVGNREGIILFFRILSVLIQMGVCCYFYETFKKQYDRIYVLIASICFFSFIPDFQSFTYKQELMWFTLLEIIFYYRYYLCLKRKYIVFLGVMIACSVLAYPTAVLQLPVWIGLLLGLHKLTPEDKIFSGKWEIQSSIIIILTCCLCGLAFLAFVLKRISVGEFIYYFPRVFTDDNLDSSFLSKLVHPVVKFMVIGLATLIPVIICERINLIKNCKLLLLLLAFGGQAYIERKGITWHCITYPYALTIFLMAYVYYQNKEKAKILLYSFEIPAITTVLCMALASNQGNITSMYGTVFSALGFLLMLGDCKIQKGIKRGERKWIAAALCTLALSMYLFPVWEQESVIPDTGERLIFTERIMENTGPAKGIKMGRESHEKYENICETVKDYVTEEDFLFIIEDAYTAAYGYLVSPGKYATYSPQGGWGVAESNRAVEYFRENPQKCPTIVLVSLAYIGRDVDSYLKMTPVGIFLQDNSYDKMAEENGYVVMRKRHNNV